MSTRIFEKMSLKSSVLRLKYSRGYADLFAIILLAFSALTAGSLALSTTQNQQASIQRIAGTGIGDYNENFGGYIRKAIGDAETTNKEYKCDGNKIVNSKGPKYSFDCSSTYPPADKCTKRNGVTYCIDTKSLPPNVPCNDTRIKVDGKWKDSDKCSYSCSFRDNTYYIYSREKNSSNYIEAEKCSKDYPCTNDGGLTYCKPNPAPPPPAVESINDCKTNSFCQNNGFNICIRTGVSPAGKCIAFNSQGKPSQPSLQCRDIGGVLRNDACYSGFCGSDGFCTTPSGGQTGGCKNDEECPPDKPYCIESGPSLGTCKKEVPSGEICKGIDGEPKQACPSSSTCRASNDTYVCGSPGGPPPPPPARTTKPQRPAEDGFCGLNNADHTPIAGEESAAAKCANGSTDNPDGDKYCQETLGNRNSYWYKCLSTGAPPVGRDEPPITRYTACKDGNPPGPDDSGGRTNGYVAPICMGKEPTSSNYTEGLFKASEAIKGTYKDAKYFDVYSCKDKSKNGGYDFIPVGGNPTECKNYPWKQDAKGNVPEPPSGIVCPKDKPYYNEKSPKQGVEKCEPRPYACPNSVGGKENVCQPSECAANAAPNLESGIKGPEADALCKQEVAGTNFCCSKTASSSPPRNAGSRNRADGSTCDEVAQCQNPSQKVCSNAWDNNADKFCCPTGTQWCVNNKSCVSSQSACPRSGSRTNPPKDISNACPQRGIRGGTNECTNTACGSNSPDIDTSKYTYAEANQACKNFIGMNYCCLKQSANTNSPPANPPPASLPTSCDASSLATGNAQCGNNNGPDSGINFCGGNYKWVSSDTNCGSERYCYVCTSTASTSSSQSIASENSCSTNIECLQNRTGSVCVFYSGNTSGVCKAN